MLHADETPVRLLDPGAGKTAKAYVWAYASGEHDGTPGVIYDFCTGRGSKYPANFLKTWTGTLTCDDYGGYDAIFRREGCVEGGCLAHARRKFDELAKAHASPVAVQAIQRIARIYRLESQAREMTVEDRLAHRQQYTKPLWNELHEPHPALGTRAQVVAVRRQRTGGQAGGDGDEPGAVGQAPWARPLGLPQGRARAAAGASEQPHRRVVAAPLDASGLTDRTAPTAIVKMAWPAAYRRSSDGTA